MKMGVLLLWGVMAAATAGLTTHAHASEDINEELEAASVPIPFAFDPFTMPPDDANEIPGFEVTPEAKRFWPLGKGETKNAIKALGLALDGKHREAQEIKSELDDPTTRKLIDWLWVHARRGWPDRAFLQRFARENPDWPRAHRLQGRIERSLYAGDAGYREVRSYFADKEPKTPAGMVVYARNLIQDGKTEEATRWIKKAYRTVSLPSKLAAEIAKEHKDMLDDDDRRARLDGLIVHHETTLAVRAAGGMDDKFQKYARAAHKLLTGARDAPGAYQAVALKLRYQPGLQYARVRYQLRKKKPKRAAEIMLKANSTGNALPYPEQWWKLRRSLVRDAVEKKKAPFSKEFAYELAKAHGVTEGKFLTDAEWLAGWMAFSFLKKPELAVDHFRRSAETAIRSHDKARGHYWLAESLAELNKLEEALFQHQVAAGFGFTFYGLLSESYAGGFRNEEPLPPSAHPTHAQEHAVVQSELVQAVQMLAHEDARKTLKVFFKSMANTFDTPGEHGALMQVAHDIGGIYLAQKFARYSEWRGIHVGTPAFPIEEAIPKIRPLTEKQVEQPLILGVARQESEFNREAVSHVGARGLMQIMPATARWLCRLHKVTCSSNRLTKDPKFNVQLGSAFLVRLVREWRSSYIMAVAAYNAGSGRVQKWNAEFGDPRKGEISPIDWIELIPFNETRNYVKRVMRNVQIYRRLMNPDAQISLVEDISRGAKAKSAKAEEPAKAKKN